MLSEAIMTCSLDLLLRPRSMAVIGASPRTGFSTRLIQGVSSLGFSGDLFLVNPKYQVINGEACYPNVRSLPTIPDCALFAVGNNGITSAVEQAAEAGVRA